MKLKTLTMVAAAGLLLQACASTPAVEESAAAVDMYRVKDGENLMLIAEKVYGSRSDWTKIYEANMDTIADPALIFPGQEIVLPR